MQVGLSKNASSLPPSFLDRYEEDLKQECVAQARCNNRHVVPKDVISSESYLIRKGGEMFYQNSCQDTDNGTSPNLECTPASPSDPVETDTKQNSSKAED